MSIPSNLPAGSMIREAWLRSLVRGAKSQRVLRAPGQRIRRTPYGTTLTTPAVVAAAPATRGYPWGSGFSFGLAVSGDTVTVYSGKFAWGVNPAVTCAQTSLQLTATDAYIYFQYTIANQQAVMAVSYGGEPDLTDRAYYRKVHSEWTLVDGKARFGKWRFDEPGYPGRYAG